MPPLLEICVENVQSAQKAERGGADRIELCSALSLGGLTPSAGLIEAVKKAVSIPVFVMIRPREGDFIYNEVDVSVMEKDAQQAIDLGADGLVFGALDKHGLVDTSVCSRLISFDDAFNCFEALETLVKLKFTNILTSGTALDAYIGRHKIKDFVLRANSRINIVAGCGINVANLKFIMDATHADGFHASTRKQHSNLVPSPVRLPSVVEGCQFYYTASERAIKELKKIICPELY